MGLQESQAPHLEYFQEKSSDQGETLNILWTKPLLPFSTIEIKVPFTIITASAITKNKF